MQCVCKVYSFLMIRYINSHLYNKQTFITKDKYCFTINDGY